MAQTGFPAYSKTAASNATADSAQNWAEGMAPSAVNDSARGGMASMAKWRDDTNGSLITGGTSTAYTLSTNTGMDALAANYQIAFQVHTDSGGTATLNVDGKGAKPLRSSAGVELAAGALKSGSIHSATYFTSNGGEWLLHDNDGDFGAKTFSGTITAQDINASGVIASSSTSHTQPASGTTAQRPGSPPTGAIRYNTDTGGAENYNGSAWISLLPTVPTPQGYLTLLDAATYPTSPIPTSDQSAKSTVYYRPDGGNLLPISDGTNVSVRAFSELSLGLVSNHVANSIYDVFVFDDSGTIRIGTGPVWNTVTAGSGARGSGAGTTELDLLRGLLVNKNAVTMRNGSSTYSVGARAGIYLGTILIDGSAGQVTCHTSYGQSRKWGLWNAFRRRPLILKAGDGTSSWTIPSGGLRAANNNSANSLTMLSGLASGPTEFKYNQKWTVSVGASVSTSPTVGIGVNSTTATSGTESIAGVSNGASGNVAVSGNFNAEHSAIMPIGSNVITALESSTGSANTVYGTEAAMCLRARFTA